MGCYLLISTIACLVFDVASKTYDMPDERVEWGSGTVTIQCLLKEDRLQQNITNTNLYYSKNGVEYVRRFSGDVTYSGVSNESVQLNDDGSLILPADYNSIGEHVCIYLRPTSTSRSYSKTLTNVTVLEPPLQVLECNTTGTNRSRSLCQVTVPNGTQSLTFTVIKAGLRSNGTISHVHTGDVSVLTKTPNITGNADNSTTISARFEVDVSDLMTSSNLSFILGGRTTEKYLVVLNKAQLIVNRPNDALTAGQITGTAIGVIAGLFIISLVVLVVLVKSNTCSLEGLTQFLRRRKSEGSPVPTGEAQRDLDLEMCL